MNINNNSNFYQNSIMSFLQKEGKCVQNNIPFVLYVSTYKIVIKILKFSVYLMFNIILNLNDLFICH